VRRELTRRARPSAVAPAGPILLAAAKGRGAQEEEEGKESERERSREDEREREGGREKEGSGKMNQGRFYGGRAKQVEWRCAMPTPTGQKSTSTGQIKLKMVKLILIWSNPSTTEQITLQLFKSPFSWSKHEGGDCVGGVNVWDAEGARGANWSNRGT
jgi:hypothetical protein